MQRNFNAQIERKINWIARANRRKPSKWNNEFSHCRRCRVNGGIYKFILNKKHDKIVWAKVVRMSECIFYPFWPSKIVCIWQLYICSGTEQQLPHFQIVWLQLCRVSKQKKNRNKSNKNHTKYIKCIKLVHSFQLARLCSCLTHHTSSLSSTHQRRQWNSSLRLIIRDVYTTK